MIPKLTKEQAAIIGAYTGFLCGPFQDVHEYIEKIMERPVWTHEMALESIMKQIKERSCDDFLSLCSVGETECPDMKSRSTSLNRTPTS